MKLRRVVVGSGLVAVMLAIGACAGNSSKSSENGGSSGGSSASGREITCDSLSTATAERILGAPVEAPSPSVSPSTGCAWYLANTGTSVQGITALNTPTYVFDGTLRGRDTPAVKELFTIEDVSGLGDAAYYQSPTEPPTSTLVASSLLLVKQGDKAYNISVTKKGATPSEIKEMERQVAEEILKG